MTTMPDYERDVVADTRAPWCRPSLRCAGHTPRWQQHRDEAPTPLVVQMRGSQKQRRRFRRCGRPPTKKNANTSLTPPDKPCPWSERRPDEPYTLPAYEALVTDEVQRSRSPQLLQRERERNGLAQRGVGRPGG